ncbi:MAG TPA: fibronectin type III domain-containing protein [Acidimicrobiales bacterium]|nr:fibronectin type III domain-containing protein [Acidimicrobiales bacterium]
MRSLRVVGAATVAALAALAVPGAPPALAQAPVVTITTPGEGATLAAPPAVAGTIEMRNGGTVTRASVTLASLDGHTTEGATHNYERGGTANSPIFTSGAVDAVQFSFTVSPRHNGAYTVTANGTGRDPAPDINGDETSANTVRRFNIEFPPVAPSGVSASIDAATRRVTVTWAANPEPDMVGYQVQRAYGTGSYREIGTTPAVAKPSFVDDLSDTEKFPAGQYRYRVIAIRRARTCANPASDAACNRGITSGASAFDDVTVRSTTTTTASSGTARTTTTVRGGGDAGGSTGGGSTGGGSTRSGGTISGVPGGKVDLSDFGKLGGKGSTSYIPDRQDDGTFGELEYGERPADDETESDPGVIEIGAPDVGPLKTSDDWVKFLGAGSLATAMLVHVLWFKGQVDNFPLEAVAPRGD